MEIDPSTLPWNSVYKTLTGSVVPRPIGWISTVDSAGNPNLAPFSFFNVACANPPTVLFCPMVRTVNGQPKDTLRNIRETGEFVVNIVSGELVEAMNRSSVEAPHDLNEFEFAGVTAIPSLKVKAPRVAESPIHFECTVRAVIEIGDQPGSGSIVIGTVVHIHADERVMIGTDKINLAELQPVGRLAGTQYSRVTDIIEMERPASLFPKP
jgi:flavin reductase (DIM6/NTAB) family NADH-FMN oxidoreductase RutF